MGCAFLAPPAGCSQVEPCEPHPVPESGRELVLASGVVCKDKGGVMSIDYPSETSWQRVESRYAADLAKSGWSVSKAKTDGMLLAKKGTKTVLIVLMDNQDRGVPTAVVTY